MMVTSDVVFSAQPGPQTDFLSTTADVCIYGGAAGGGKVAPKDSLVLTPWGYKPMGEVKKGDQICNPDGSQQKVLEVFPHKDWEFYKITFKDGSTCEVGKEHLWVSWRASVSTKRGKTLGKKLHIPSDSLYPSHAEVINTEGLMDWLGRGHTPLIPVTAPIEFTNSWNLLVDSYTLGLLLGDGCLNSGFTGFTSKDPELQDHFKEAYSTHQQGIDLRIHRKDAGKVLKEALDHYGLLSVYSNKKFIPYQYKFAPLESRIALLQGLMDTDGTIDDRGHLSYCTVSPQLRDDVKHLVETLGGWATVSEKQGSYLDSNGDRVECQLAYTLYIKLPDSIQPFRLERKLSKVKKTGKRLYRSVAKIEFSRVSDGQCIMVNNPNRLYLMDNCIVTHNTFALLLEQLRHIDSPTFRSIIFRTNSTEIRNQGGLWDVSGQIYPQLGGVPRENHLDWTFPSGFHLKFAHLQYDKDLQDYQGAQIPLICFDELTTFTERQFTFLLGRNRSTTGVSGYVRATCNPDVNSWVRRWIDWWIGEDGLPIPARSGVIRYYAIVNDELVWGDSAQELVDLYGNPELPLDHVDQPIQPLSFTFIAATIFDNKELLKKDPTYLKKLRNLSKVDQERFLGGNWNSKANAGTYFKREWLEVVEAPPPLCTRVRAYDRAATEATGSNNPDWTAGVQIAKSPDGIYYICHVDRYRLKSGAVDNRMKAQAALDGKSTRIVIAQDPGSAGKAEAAYTVKLFPGYDIRVRTSTKDKLTNFLPFTAAAENGLVKIVRGLWNEVYLSELEHFIGDGKGKDDQVDATSLGFNELSGQAYIPPVMNLTSLGKKNLWKG
jgi:predicted phage terminase large subunit-like protein